MIVRRFEPGDAAAFRSLNEDWITRLFRLEPKDIAVLSDPEAKIIAPGGQIFIADADGQAIGCCALARLADGGFELAKMAVDPLSQGAGAGRALMAAACAYADGAGAPRIYIETHSSLGPAIHLYRAFGFEDLAPERRPPAAYERVDVWMERLR